jgi:PIN domain nuclease of toxin-antitoxin system
LIDTHVALWLDSDDDRLRPSTRGLIDSCWQSGGTTYLSAVTAWEVALLVDIGGIELDLPIEEWITRFIQRPGIDLEPLAHRAASRSYRLHHFEDRDPADRLLIATAIELGCPLVSYDERILRFDMVGSMGSLLAPNYPARSVRVQAVGQPLATRRGICYIDKYVRL